MSAAAVDPRAREGGAYWSGYAAGETAQREADAVLVATAGCNCHPKMRPDLRFSVWIAARGSWSFDGDNRPRLDQHAPDCPRALAELIRRRP